MKNILIIGSTGFIGKNLCEYLKTNKNYIIESPTSKELNILNEKSVEKYLRSKYFDVIIHSAVYNPRTDKEKNADMELENDLRMFFNFEKNQNLFGKMLYFGSGAEFDKKYPISQVSELSFPKNIPNSQYGFAKYIINKQIQQSKNIYNLRIFGLFGKYENWKKTFISGACCKALKNIQITIKQNVYFDYLFINDFCKIVSWFIENTPKFHNYNVVSGEKIDLITIAKKIVQISGKDIPIIICKKGLANEYTANNDRLLAEVKNINFMPISKSIKLLYAYYKNHEEMINLIDLLYS